MGKLCLLCVLVYMAVSMFSVGTFGRGIPEETEAHPDGFWFGTQSLPCVLTATGSKGQTVTRRKREVVAPTPVPTRNPLKTRHRLLFYRGQVYEWGTGPNGYHYGPGPVEPQCQVTWEELPAGESSCDDLPLTRFAREYREKYGTYHLLTNNCHHFANRLSALLKSEECSSDRNLDKLWLLTTELGKLWDGLVWLLSNDEDNDDRLPVVH